MSNYCTHCFSVELAAKIGMREAIVLQHFYWWHQHNKAVESMNIDGKVWFYLTNDQIKEVFPYLTTSAVRSVIENLIKGGYVEKSHRGSFDRTTWYALTICGISQFHLSISANAFAKNDNIVNNKDNKKVIISPPYNSPQGEEPKREKFDFRKAMLEAGVTPEVADTWMQVRKSRKAVNSELAWNEVAAQIEKSGLSADECIRIAAANSWRGFKAEWISKTSPRPIAGGGSRRPSQEANPLDYDFTQDY